MSISTIKVSDKKETERRVTAIQHLIAVRMRKLATIVLLYLFASNINLTCAENYHVIYINGESGSFNSSCWNGGEEMPCASLDLALKGAEYLNSTTVIVEQSQCVGNTTTNVYTTISESKASSSITDCPPWVYPNGSIRECGDSPSVVPL